MVYTTDMNFKGQHEGENVLFYFRQHPVVMRKYLLASLLLLTITMLPWSLFPLNRFAQYAALGGFIAAILLMLYRWSWWYYSLNIVTDQRILQDIRKGFFNRQVIEIDLNKVQSVNYEVPGLQATIFKFGTIVVQTFVGDMVIEKVHRPAETHGQLTEILREYESEIPFVED